MKYSKPLALAICLLVACADWTEAQTARTNSSYGPSPHASRVRRYRPSIHNPEGYKGVQLRGERLRFSTDRLARDRKGLLPALDPSADPIYYMLMSRNLLSAESLVVQNALFNAGRNDYRKLDGKWVSDTTNIPYPIMTPATLEVVDGVYTRPEKIDLSNTDGKLWSTDPGSYNDILEARLHEQGRVFYAKGTAAFQKGDHLTAEHYFALYEQVDDRNPSAIAAKAILSYARENRNEAIVNLNLTLKRTTSLDQLSLKREDFYPSKPEFDRLVSDLNLSARSAGASPRVSLLLAFYQWLDGDLGGAISSLDTAIQGLEAEGDIEDARKVELSQFDRTAFARNFRTLLIEARAQKKAAETPATPAP